MSRAALATKVEELSNQVAVLTASLAKVQQVQAAALQAVTFLPQEVASLLNEQNLGDGQMTPDGAGMTYKVGELLTVTIYPFREEFVLTDAGGKIRPLWVRFGPDHPVTDKIVLEVLGFQALVLNPTITTTPSSFWATGVNALRAPATTTTS